MKNGDRKSITSGALAELLGGVLRADADILLTGVSEPQECGPGDILVVKKNPQAYADAMRRASLVVIAESMLSEIQVPSLVVPHVEKAFVSVLSYFNPYSEDPAMESGIHPSASIGPNCKIGFNVHVGQGSSVGEGSCIHPNVVVGKNVIIGKRARIHTGVVIHDFTQIGDDVLIKENTIIGGKGFGYIQTDGTHLAVPQIGNVRIGDHVDIGSCCCIDRATLGSTVIEDWVKIDNLCQIAHNVHIHRAAIIISQVGISGSSTVGENSILAGQVGLADHVHVGKNVLVGAQSGVSKNIPDGEAWFGYPARPMMRAKRIESVISKLPEIYKELDKLLGEKKNV